MSPMSPIDTIVGLSHEFGTPHYVKGGGGNTSVKSDTTLWVKPSGTTLAGLTPSTFVAMNRAKINELYTVEAPSEPAAREELVKNLMAEAVENDAGRPSVEAPLHNVFEAQYVVHTHPPKVNGMTCAKDAAETCAALFPDALWVEYIDPGYTLCMEVRQRIERFKAQQGREPAILMLKNHGVFVSADSADEIRTLYKRVTDTLDAAYLKAGISDHVVVADAPCGNDDSATIQSLFGEDAAFISTSGLFPVAPGPISPDHLVYAKAFPFIAELTPEAAAEYKKARGYAPKVVVTNQRVYGLGTCQKNADLALELALDATLVRQLAQAFNGVDYMTDTAREFIENWEVESYRQKQVT